MLFVSSSSRFQLQNNIFSPTKPIQFSKFSIMKSNLYFILTLDFKFYTNHINLRQYLLFQAYLSRYSNTHKIKIPKEKMALSILSLFLSIFLLTSLPLYFPFKRKNHPTDDEPLPSPIIGVLTQPSPFAKAGYHASNYSYIPASYVKHLESAGATVVPIQWDLPFDEIDSILGKINGVLLPGGGTTLVITKTKKPTKFAKTGMHIIKKAIEFNDNGDHFPIWGTCLGYELLLLAVSKNMSLLIDVDGANDVAKTINVTEEGLEGLYANMDSHLLHKIQTENLSYYHHKHTPDPKAFTTNANLKSNFSVAAWTLDSEGEQYAAMVQGKVYPFTGTQFHPEKNTFEWATGTAIPHSLEAVMSQQHYAYYFVNQTLKSKHGFGSVEELGGSWIYKQQAKHLSKDSDFEQVYLFENCESYSPKEKLVSEYPRGYELSESEEESNSDIVDMIKSEKVFKFKEAASFLSMEE